MACGLEFRQPTAELRRLWHELRLLNDTLGTCVKAAEEYLRDLDGKVSATKVYFADIKSRIAGIPRGQVRVGPDLQHVLAMPAAAAAKHFQSMRDDAADNFARVSEERRKWMAEAGQLMRRQMIILNRLDGMTLQLAETRGLRGRLVSTYRDITSVEEEVKSLQKVLFDCEMGRADLEEDYVTLIRTFQQLSAGRQADAGAAFGDAAL
ncbi:uncharacterized protein LOC129582284 [Paramacrobiotus metropolitanus]|uniref:uncharacterized protein LOC129582284 n=1 Tax=Paramacrobiotus metropolitanus TaxID=2943436 RepID=UPI002445D271|nr:uncharacterized protein LOC129582284 [Paramacrobiotus metropolitanus]